MRRLFISIVLIIILGVPACWYLFLQFYGENKFELPVIQKLPENCRQFEQNTFVLRREITSISAKNEFDRLVRYSSNKNIIIKVEFDFCTELLNNYSVLLIDKNSHIRGQYELTIKDIDRAIVELDLLNELTK